MVLLSIYVGCLIVGGGLLGASFFTDHDSDADVDHDFDADVDADHDFHLGGGDVADVDADVDADHDLDHDGDMAHVSAADALWLPFLSLRFWLFFVAFFGLTGTLLEGMSLAAWQVGLGTSLGMGFVCGYTAARIVQTLRKEQVSSAVDPRRDYVGKRGTVLLDVAPGQMGQVRVDARGASVDLDAEVADGSSFKRGDEVIVLAYEGGRLKVARFDTGEGDADERSSQQRIQA